jgi:L-ascorbate metabolism protein UlaG (beta-lactamase superfamily)
MKITKLGHCCILIEEQGLRILTDPGAWTMEQSKGQKVDVILITHEHQDHFHVPALKELLATNPNVVVMTNETVGKLLDAEGVKYTRIKHGEVIEHKGVKVEGFGEHHAVVYESYGQTENTGFMVADKFFFPGDSLFNPNKYIEALALPVAGPWLTIAHAIDYAKAIHPKKCFPVHDGFLSIRGFLYYCVTTFLQPYGIEFVDTDKNNSFEI